MHSPPAPSDSTSPTKAVRPHAHKTAPEPAPADPASARPGFQPGLLWLQSPALEDLAETLCAWWSRYPAHPLEEEVVLVPSNGMAEWFKAESCRLQGVFSGPRVELPARFAWRVYRTVLGPAALSARKLDKSPLPWLLLRTASQWAEIESVRHQLNRAGLSGSGMADVAAEGTQVIDLFRWCSHTADLFDQYQLFRPDWLSDWAEGLHRLRVDPNRLEGAPSIPADQHWQADLWAWLNIGQAVTEQGFASRAALHRSCIKQLRLAPVGSLSNLPSRVVLFGATSLPPAVMELLDALSRHLFVVLAVPNPCQVQWTDLADSPHQGQPLLAAWGKQARDFLTQVDRFEAKLEQLEDRPMVRVERDSTPLEGTALSRLQVSIYANEPLHEVAADVSSRELTLEDGSIQFIRAHSALREVEILHDFLLHQLTSDDEIHRPQPRDVVVMVPNLKTHAAAVRAVFSAYGEDDPRHIPWGIADQSSSADQGLHEIASWLLSLPTQRCGASELRRLLDSSAIGKRWSLDEDDRRQLRDWVEASGIRWGLSAAHRESLDLGTAGEAMTWQFGVDRMLAGYAGGGKVDLAAKRVTHEAEGDAIHDAHDADWAPLENVRGLAARAAGQLAGLLHRLEAWRVWAMHSHRPSEWATAFRQLWADLVQADNLQQERECEALECAIHQWLRNTQDADFDLPIGHLLAHHAILELLEQPAAQGRFRANGVTFCTLMPLRAVPFRIVCLLGMDDGQYPRPSKSRPADLMALPDLARPGDRSRRVDDRQLMLDALLSARQQLFISWVGQQATDNQHRPPSVLVGQLRDALATIWGAQAVAAITIDHPMQPFNPAYFQVGRLPATHAHEWQSESPERAVKSIHPVDEEREPLAATDSNPAPDPDHANACDALQQAATPTTTASREQTARILRWLKCPVTAFLDERLGVRWPRPIQPLEDDEPLEWGGITEWTAWNGGLNSLTSADFSASGDHTLPVALRWPETGLSHLRQSGLLPLAAPGQLAGETMLNVLRAQRLHLEALRSAHEQHRVLWAASRFSGGKPFSSKPCAWRLDLLVEAWWLQLQAAARGEGFVVHLLTPDTLVSALPADAAQAQNDLQAVGTTLTAWMAADHPMPATSRLLAASRRPPSEHPRAIEREADRNAAWRRSFGGAEDWAWKEWSQGRPVKQWLEATEELYGPFWRWCDHSLKVAPIVPLTSVLKSGQAPARAPHQSGYPAAASTAGQGRAR